MTHDDKKTDHRAAARDALSKCHLTRVGDTLHLYDDSTKEQVEKLIEKQLVAGESRVDLKNGTETYYEDEVIFDVTKQGSERYTWDKSGNRVKYNRFQVTITTDKKTGLKDLKKALKKTIFKAF
jgi:hypothetical protein